jgi:hypothetical protein
MCRGAGKVLGDAQSTFYQSKRLGDGRFISPFPGPRFKFAEVSGMYGRWKIFE